MSVSGKAQFSSSSLFVGQPQYVTSQAPQYVTSQAPQYITSQAVEQQVSYSTGVV
eukprot:CAMPEP_0204252258 /NCGR_PEP_ID=MMETSP0468-20130131/1032_1 /ASSEMBLY_ACC=CAM_ASM_000383 /TAXON_ID=2969 /ORGANISM="Oxyrrhis marina" /LENGTH=54 /DNA_ID=CAMNT_0051225669 /DNA_START=73 /DNA_END=234 /DNA_ORIENTATION=-